MAGWKRFALFRKKNAAAGKAKGASKSANADLSRSAVVVAPQSLPREVHRRDREQDSLPRFNATASDQLSIRTTEKIAVMRAKVGNAFTPSQPIGDRKMFAGREDTFRSIISAIEDQRLHIVLYGERGIGKTSLLHMLTQAASEARYIVIYTSCGADSKFDETFRAAAGDISLRFHKDFSPTAEEAEKGATLVDLLPIDPVSPRQFADLCAKLIGTRVLIILDEFDRCESTAFRRDVAELVKNLSDRLGRVQLVLAGVAADLTELVEHIPSIRRNIHAIKVPKMSDLEVLEIIDNGERDVGLTFEGPARDLTVAVSRGSPYLGNLLCHHAAHSALAEGRSTVLTSDIALSIRKAEAEFESRISTSLQAQVRRLIEGGHNQVLDLVARTAVSRDGPIGTSDIQVINQVDAAEAQRMLERLAEAGLMKIVEEREAGELYEFLEEGLPTYLWLTSTLQNLGPEKQRARAGLR